MHFTNHCRLLLMCLSNRVITPLNRSTFTLVPSHPITFNWQLGNSLITFFLDSAIVLEVPLIGRGKCCHSMVQKLGYNVLFFDMSIFH